MNIIVILLFVSMIGVVIALTAGIVLMARGGEVNRKYGNRLMQSRVWLQGIALALLAILFMNKGS